MSDLVSVLETLETAVGGLETALAAREKKGSEGQIDMFSTGAAPANANPQAIARTLDVAIERIETVLKEG